jgi:site-specific DNA-methyltransferase (adenine-specific)
MGKFTYAQETETLLVNNPLDSLFTIAEPTPTSPNQLAYCDNTLGVYLYYANCLEVMDSILEKHPNGCFDMIFADPPYFLSNGGITCQNGKMVSVDKGQWDKSMGAEVNHAFDLEWLRRCHDLLKPNGTIWVSGTMHSIFSAGFAMQKIGFKILNDISWQKPNPPPNLACRYFTHATETIIWASKSSKSKHNFQYDVMKNENGGRQMKSVWTIAPPARCEKEFGKHPTQKPLALLERCIKASTNPGDFVLDPFAGSSTTGVAAIGLGRRYCGIEMEHTFIELSKQRLNNAKDFTQHLQGN